MKLLTKDFVLTSELCSFSYVEIRCLACFIVSRLFKRKYAVSERPSTGRNRLLECVQRPSFLPGYREQVASLCEWVPSATTVIHAVLTKASLLEWVPCARAVIHAGLPWASPLEWVPCATTVIRAGCNVRLWVLKCSKTPWTPVIVVIKISLLAIYESLC